MAADTKELAGAVGVLAETLLLLVEKNPTQSERRHMANKLRQAGRAIHQIATRRESLDSVAASPMVRPPQGPSDLYAVLGETFRKLREGRQ